MPDETVVDLLKTLDWLKGRRNFLADVTNVHPEYQDGACTAYDEVIHKVEQMLNQHAVTSAKFAEQVQRKLRENAHTS